MAFVNLLLLLLFINSYQKILFQDSFEQDYQNRWINSNWDSQNQGTHKQVKYTYKDKSYFQVKTMTDMKRYVFSRKIEPAIDTSSGDFIFQFSVKLNSDPGCGGHYIKFFGKDFDPENFDNLSPLLIMFGPDVCGGNKIHFILDVNGDGKFWSKSHQALTDDLMHFYTFKLSMDDSYQVFLDNEVLSEGKISEDWVNDVPEFIPDPNVKKPEDWDDRMYIEDPESEKPEDWDDREFIDDPNSFKPEEWDDTKEEWVPEKIANPNYKGPYSAPKLYNPSYQGIWQPPKIKNPNYVTLSYKGYTIGGLGFELMQTKSGTEFGNIMITNDIEEAKSRAKELMEGVVQVQKEEIEKIKAEQERLRQLEIEKREKEEKERNEARMKDDL